MNWRHEFDEWLTKRIDFYEGRGLNNPALDGIRDCGISAGLQMARQYLRENYVGESAHQCNHYWVKALPLDEINQAYLCLNCDLLKKG
ncbi:MAG: hypothetical protein R6U84_05475 [Candidatus Cloacimonadales bacterium]